MTEISRELFLGYLHSALDQLYNADQLRRSPLAEMFGVANRFDTSAALRKILADAIAKLKPPDNEPDQSKAWRTYESLYCCFIQQLNQQIVADQLCISSRQLRREQHAAMESLADLLWREYRLGETPVQPAPEEPPANSGLLGEMGWLIETQPVGVTALEEEIQAALEIVRPLAQRGGVSLEAQVEGDLPHLAVHSAALNQVLVSLVSVAIEQVQESPPAAVLVGARRLELGVELVIQAKGSSRLVQQSPETGNNLAVASELVRLSGGRLSHGPAGALLPIRVILPALEQVPVLVIDDNDDALQLMKRYAAGTRFGLTTTKDTAAVLGLVEEIQPRLIVLDIMMPKENGWIVLGRLRQHPLTGDVPIIVCTILPQEKLALSLGANAFLKKPVSREAFLETLNRQLALQEPEFP